ncbi:hypothetical protein NQ317_011063 [Molorchus minor]|uniref:DNA-directed DNA polymerase n=1 Tax=Molorchus minor TaxID=1323400 RepID=A0ABQ9J391_9CUCU|nr:hypothetical protein NQ317_011063 [Molorchus minor]
MYADFESLLEPLNDVEISDSELATKNFPFMGCSLDQLASTLVDENFKDLKQEFSALDDGKLKLLMRKGVFFYDYLDKIERLDETKLPDIEHFYNKLNDMNIDETNYAHAQLIWLTFNIQTLGEYSDLYMKTDIILLTSVFETFGKPVTRHTRLTRDITSSSRLHANNKYLDDYDSNKPSTYLMYFDVNNLYGWPMSQPPSVRRSPTEKNNFKLMNNAVFGKSMQNVRKHRIVKLVNKWEGRYGAKNLIASPNFDSRSIFSDTLMAIEMKKSRIVFDKPLYIGMAILDISKTCVYEFHYDYMLQKFPVEKFKLLYTDTDSLVYELQRNDASEEVIGKDIDRFDTSDYPKDNLWNIP